MSIGIGLCINNTRAVLEALFNKETEFARTPKCGSKGTRTSGSARSIVSRSRFSR